MSRADKDVVSSPGPVWFPQNHLNAYQNHPRIQRLYLRLTKLPSGTEVKQSQLLASIPDETQDQRNLKSPTLE